MAPSNFNPSKTRDFKPQGAQPVQLSAPVGPRLGTPMSSEARPIPLGGAAVDSSGPRNISRPASDRSPVGGKQVVLAGAQLAPQGAPSVKLSPRPTSSPPSYPTPSPKMGCGEDAYKIEVMGEDENGNPYVAEMGEVSFPVGTKIMGMRHTKV